VIEKNKDQKAILNKLGIDKLNKMQEDAHKTILSNSEIVLLSPTGTGKTLAFLLPIIAELEADLDQVQVLILVPSRELAMQIEQVVREMGSGFKTNAVYGGRAGSKDKIELKHPPAILIGTPGRVADHMRRETISTENIKTLVLDEFDKSLEVGFEKEMREIVSALPSINKKILTSATQSIEIPDFVGIEQPENLNYLSEVKNQLKLNTILSPTQDKLDTLEKLLGHIGEGSGIVFCNFKDSIQIVSNFFREKNIGHSCFYGGLEQIDRERALIKFRNGTHRLLIATDLAARGIDVPEMDFIIHYQLPTTKEEFTHRNGRTARMHSSGTAYIMKWEDEALPEFIEGSEIEKIRSGPVPNNSKWETLYISGGRKDKISKGDIAGLFFKQGKLQKDELGTIELKQDYAYVAVPGSKTKELIAQLNNSKIKKRKVRISLLN
jgi:superfamily II DNA/RNA helicase